MKTLLIIAQKEIRDALASAFTDEKFKWNVSELMEKVDKGQLNIANLNPVKAFVIIKKIE